MQARVPLLNLGAAHEELRAELDKAWARVNARSWYILGPEVEAFEAEFAASVGANHCVGVGNGLDALHLALLAMDVGPGDDVIVPAHTYIATWLAVSQAGARLVPVECDPATFTLDVAQLEWAMTPRTRVILPVHLYGQAADLDPIFEIASRRGARVLEDAAQAHGTRYRGRPIGSSGDAVAWSFYPTKNLGALGDGGAVTTNDSDLADQLRVLRNYGSRTKYLNERRGFNTRLDELQAALLRAKLPHLEKWNARRRAAADRYGAGLAGTPLTLPTTPAWCTPAWHLYVIRTRERDSVRRALHAAGVETMVHYPIPPFRQKAYAELAVAAGRWPVADRLAREVLSLPMSPHLTVAEQDVVINTLSECLEQADAKGR
jgi:dTDP-4-amino-4,6-dideoxygalactose transaminase